ncbi:MAG: DUF4012 domain-containing protein [Actinomycetota bacterium]
MADSKGEGTTKVVDLERRRIKVRERVRRGHQIPSSTTAHRLRKTSRKKATAFSVAAIALLLLLDGLYVGLRLNSSLRSAREQFEAAEAYLGNGRFRHAEAELSGALVDSGTAVGLTRHPSFFLVKWIPIVGSDAEAVGAVARAAELSARAGLSVARIPAETGEVDGSIAAAVFQGGRVNFNAIRSAQPVVSEAAASLDEAARLLQEAPIPRIESLKTVFLETRSKLARAAGAAVKGDALMRELPALFGANGWRQYLLAFQTPSEARGGGGLLGIYGILEARKGRIRLTRVAPIGELTGPPRARADDMPGWFNRTYGQLGALRQYQQANLTPNFPVAAEAWLQMYEGDTGQRLDGVVAMDPIALGEMLRGTGPIKARGLDVAVGPENAGQVLLYDSYTEFDDVTAQNRYLAGLIDAFWRRLNGDIDAHGFVSGLAEAASTNHLKAYVPEQEEALGELEADGDYTAAGPNVQVVFNNNAGVNKIDYFLHRRVQTIVRLLEDGSAEVTTTATLRNGAPTDAPRSLIFGPGIGGIEKPGLNAMFLHFVLPESAKVMSFVNEGNRKQPFRGSDGGRPMVFDLFDVAASRTRSASVEYQMDQAFVADGSGAFSFTMWPQATVNPDEFSLRVIAPDGYVVVDPGTGEEAQQMSISGTLNAVRTMRVQVEK